MAAPRILPPPESGAVMTSRAEFFILNEESETPAIPREYEENRAHTSPPCGVSKTIQLSNATEKRFFCADDLAHEGMHTAKRLVDRGDRVRVIARWVD